MARNIIESVGDLELVHVMEKMVVSGDSVLTRVNVVQFTDYNLSLQILKEGQLFWRTNIALQDAGRAHREPPLGHFCLAQVSVCCSTRTTDMHTAAISGLPPDLLSGLPGRATAHVRADRGHSSVVLPLRALVP